jgi:5-methylcytosine-specific restriction endonuclease McrA
MYYRTDERKFYSYEFQCQGCGVLKYSDEYSEKGKLVALKDHCECGGQFRSDKNIFCPSCHHRKSEVNKFDSKVVLTEKELEVLEKCHGE